MQSKVSDVPEDKALRAASALASAFAKAEDETAKSFKNRDGAIDKLSAEVSALNNKLTAEIAALTNRIASEVAARNAKIVKLDGDVGLLK